MLTGAHLEQRSSTVLTWNRGVLLCSLGIEGFYCAHWGPFGTEGFYCAHLE